MARGQTSFIGIDIGGSKIEAIFWSGGKVKNYQKVKTPKTRKQFLQAVFALVDSVRGGKSFQGIGIASAGAMDWQRGIILKSPNLKFLNNFPLVRAVRKKYEKPVKMDNDANCFLRGEWKFGQARNKNNVVALTLGTGVGGALVVAGQLVTGRHGAAGELGHMIIARDSNRVFTVEDLVSKHGFARLGVRHPLEYQLRAKAGDKKARAVYQKIGGYLGLALASLVNIFDPELIIFGGGISRAGRLLIGPALKEMKKHTLLPARLLPPVKISKLKYAAPLGAISLFLK